MFHRPDSQCANFSSGSTVRIFQSVSSGIADRSPIDKSPLRYLVNADIGRTGSQNQKYADARETNGKHAGSNRRGAACIFGTRRAFARRIRTLITLCVRRCITRVTPLHTCTFYTTEYVGYFAEVRHDVRI